jgi:hypothetical protein
MEGKLLGKYEGYRAIKGIVLYSIEPLSNSI